MKAKKELDVIFNVEKDIVEPCPCCGSEANLVSFEFEGFDKDYPKEYQVECSLCGLSTSPDSLKDIVKIKWNKRV